MQGGTILLLLSFAGATVFSHDIPTECPTVDPVDTTIHLQHEYNCDQFYKCYLGEKHLYDCAKGTVFDPKLQVCVWPWETECSLPGSGGDGNGDGDGDGDGDPDNGSGGDGTDGGAVIPPTECPAVDPLDTTVHLAHEYDCNKFYKCSNGVKYLYSCAPSDPPLVFDPVKQVCVWPQDFECKLPGSPGGSGGSNEQPTNGSSEPAESDEPAQSNETPEETSADSEGSSGGGAVVPPTECPAVDPLDTTVHIAHEYDCNKFYKCSNGVKYLYSCAPSDPELVFDPVLQVCVWPEDFECKLPGPPGGSGGSNEQPTNGSSEPAESDEPAQSNETPKETSADSEDSSGGGAVVPPTECPAVDPLDTTVHIAHEYDCNKFYKCSNGVKYLYSCAPSDPELVFDPVLQVCVWPEDFECKLPGSPGGSGGSNEQPTNGSSEPAESNEPAQSNETPEETSANSEDSSGGGAVVPPTECPAVDPLETTVHIAHEYDCNKFYKCSNGVKYLYSCAPSDPELVFDPVLQVCVWPEDFECKLPGSPGGSGGSNEQPTNGSSEPAESNEPGQSNETPEETSANSEDSSGGGAVVPPTECPAVDPLDTTVHIAHEYDCNKFYKCSNGVKYLYSCAPSDPELVFDPVLQVCVWPEDFECKLPGPPGGSGGSNEQPTNGSSEPTESDEPAQSNETPEETSANSEDSSGGGAVVPPTECPAVDPLDTTVHIAHEYDCNKFYKCSNGVKYLYSCAPSDPELVFDPVLQVCVWPEDFECKLPGPPGGSGGSNEQPTNGSSEPTESDEPAQSNETPEETSANSEDSSGGGAVVPPTECPAVDPLDTTVHIAHEYDCNKFYKCSNGVKYLYSCAPSDPELVFDPVLQVCVWPEDFECKLPGSPGGSGGSNEQPTNGSSEPAESNEPAQSNETPEETSANSEDSSGGGAVVPPTECPAVDPLETTVHIAHEYDCNKFYKCSNGVKYLYSCAPSDPELVFDPVLQVCVWPEDFECKLPGSPGGSGGSNEQPTNGSSEPAESNEPGQSNETPEETSANSEDSSGGGAVVPPTECPAVDPLDTTVHIAHEYDCNKFYKCSNGVKYLYSCAPSDPELVFDPVLQVCVWPEDFECKLPGPPGGSGGSNEQPTNGSSEPAESDEPAQSNETPEETSANSEDSSGGGAVVPPTECPAVDPLDTTVHIAHEYDCNKFYKCSNGVKYLYSCAPSDPELVFDPVLQVCVWPEDFECKLPGSPGGSDGSNEQPTNGSSEPAESEEPAQSNETPEETSADSEGSSGGGAVVPPTECPAVDPLDTTVHIAHEYDCNKFYKCSNGVKYLYSCAPSDPELVFDPVLQVCVWPEDFECKLPGSPGGSDGSNEQPTNGSSEPAESEEPAQSNETPEETSADSEGSSGGGAVVPPTECPAVDPLDTTVHIAHKYDCNKFYKCSNGVKYLYSCAPSDPELVFDPILQVCVWPEDFECTLPGTPGGSGGSNEQPTNGSSEPTESDEPAESNEPAQSNETSESSESSESREVDPVDVPDNSKCDVCDNNSNIWPHETDCDKFWICQNSNAVLTTCSLGLQFNTLTRTCDFACNVNCVKSGSLRAMARQNGLNIVIPWDKIGAKVLHKLEHDLHEVGVKYE